MDKEKSWQTKIKALIFGLWDLVGILSELSIFIVPFLSAWLKIVLASIWFWGACIIYVLYEITLKNKVIPTVQEKTDKKKRIINILGDFYRLVSGYFIPIYLGIFASIFIINYYTTWYNWNWLIFFAILLVVPYTLGVMAKLIHDSDKFPLKRKKAWCKLSGLMFLFCFLSAFFYVALFQNWLVGQYIFGGLILVMLLCGVANSFIGTNNPKWYKWVLLLDFIVGIGLSIYLVYKIPEQYTNLQGIATTIIAAIYGGLITLVGVAWTIKSEAKNRQDDFDKKEQERKEEEKKKAKPIFTFKPLLRKNRLSNNNSFCLFFIDDEAHKRQNKQNDEEEKEVEKEAVICIQNSDNSNFSIEALYVDKVKCLARANNIVLKSQTIYIRFDINGYEKSRFVLECEDLLGNTYMYELKLVEFTEAFYGLTSFKEIEKEEVPND